MAPLSVHAACQHLLDRIRSDKGPTQEDVFFLQAWCRQVLTRVDGNRGCVSYSPLLAVGYWLRQYGGIFAQALFSRANIPKAIRDIVLHADLAASRNDPSVSRNFSPLNDRDGCFELEVVDGSKRKDVYMSCREASCNRPIYIDKRKRSDKKDEWSIVLLDSGKVVLYNVVQDTPIHDPAVFVLGADLRMSKVDMDVDLPEACGEQWEVMTYDVSTAFSELPDEPIQIQFGVQRLNTVLCLQAMDGTNLLPSDHTMLSLMAPDAKDTKQQFSFNHTTSRAYFDYQKILYEALSCAQVFDYNIAKQSVKRLPRLLFTLESVAFLIELARLYSLNPMTRATLRASVSLYSDAIKLVSLYASVSHDGHEVSYWRAQTDGVSCLNWVEKSRAKVVDKLRVLEEVESSME